MICVIISGLIALQKLNKLFEKALAQLTLQKWQENHFTKQIPWHVSCQKRTQQWEQSSGELVLQKNTKMMAKQNVQCTKIMHRHSLAIFAGNAAVPKGPSRTKNNTPQ